MLSLGLMLSKCLERNRCILLCVKRSIYCNQFIVYLLYNFLAYCAIFPNHSYLKVLLDLIGKSKKVLKGCKNCQLRIGRIQLHGWLCLFFKNGCFRGIKYCKVKSSSWLIIVPLKTQTKNSTTLNLFIYLQLRQPA